MTITPGEERPLSLGDTPAEEGVSTADAAERVDLDPEEQPNFTQTHPGAEEAVEGRRDGGPAAG